MTSFLGVGLIGAGRIGHVHARSLVQRVQGAHLVAVADRMPDVARELAGSLGVRAVYPSADELLADPAVDAVVIATPTPAHAEVICASARAGRHVFCEKPIALDLDVIDVALAAVGQAGIALQVGFQRRFDRSFRQARARVAGGEIGRLQLVRIVSRDPAPPPIEYLRSSGGLFLDMTIHDFDMARFLAGDDVIEVTATTAVLVDPAIGSEADDVDTAVVTLQYASGALAVIDNCRQAVYGYDQRIEVLGSEGAITVGNEGVHLTTVLSREGARTAPLVNWYMDRYLDAYTAELQAFVDAVREGRPPEVDGADGRAPVAMAIAARLSAAERRPVRLTEVDPKQTRKELEAGPKGP